VHNISEALDTFSELTGRICSWFVAIMVLVTCLVVVMRYGLDMGSVLLQDVVLYLHAGLFLLGSAFALKRGAHVRVDIFYRSFSDLKKAWIDLLGNIIFLQPVCWVILLYSWGYVEESWKIMEVSPEPDGLPFVYLQKSLLVALAFSLGLQSLSEIFKSLITIKHG
tara:strand:- start:1787 stop:2284 length:498 start_codon:yes stop_codon:yes gene_type:complete